MLDSILFYAIIIIAAVAVLSVVYKYAFHYDFSPEHAPRFVFFPKYVATFDAPLEAVQGSLRALKFTPDDGDGLTFRRGKVYGDFSAKAIRLNVEIDDQRKSFRVFAPYLVILFDTGDLWRLTRDILDGANAQR